MLNRYSNSGTNSRFDTLSTRQNLVAAQKALANARYNHLINLLRLKADVGQLARSDVQDLDGLLSAAAPAPVSSP